MNHGSAGFVEEEVFENERYQPFRAWGHTWPGHFLPTDRVGHWSLSSPPANPALDTSDFDAVAPTLKKVEQLSLTLSRTCKYRKDIRGGVGLIEMDKLNSHVKAEKYCSRLT